MQTPLGTTPRLYDDIAYVYVIIVLQQYESVEIRNYFVRSTTKRASNGNAMTETF